MKTQRGFIVFIGAAWLVATGAIGDVSAADFPTKDQAFADSARLDWAGLSRGTPVPELARLDWAGLSRHTELAQDDAPNAYVGTSLTIIPARGRLDWTGLSR
jgi:hypothetical protein